ncbi:acetylxylan esterase [Deefgea tanakiae]|uniref:Acetylxylan esterase n=1 Tax=Deefgea tanakiae TaxID=2865840 RepID=A0ABX8Z2J7_9NEIS|nr:acetylxylan esterase [Deefgea tanakiae]QZA76472.1 acetylxylan esterase [Deefgea tanakiae]
MPCFEHDYSFDPRYGYSLATLLQQNPADECADFSAFWQTKYQAARQLQVALKRSPSEITHAEYCVENIQYVSSHGVLIGGWLLTPKSGPIQRGLIVGHGYGGRDAPDFNLPIENAAILFICFRGLARSRSAGISDNPNFHVLHDIDVPEQYILGGCVEDLWCAATAMLAEFPALDGHLAYMGESFGGGIGAMALAWDPRFQAAALNVPTFGDQASRLGWATVGSGAAVQSYEQQRGHVMATLQYYDAAIAARHIQIPMHLALALFDPAVAPPGQFAIFNVLAGPKTLFVLSAGHFEYPEQSQQNAQLDAELRLFFRDL